MVTVGLLCGENVKTSCERQSVVIQIENESLHTQAQMLFPQKHSHSPSCDGEMKGICRVKVMGIGDSKINNNGLERRQEDEAWLCLGDTHCLHSMSCCYTPSQSESHLQNLNCFRVDISFLLFLALLCPEKVSRACPALAQL